MSARRSAPAATPVALATAYDAVSGTVRTDRCRIAEILDSLSEPDRAFLTGLLSQPMGEVPHLAIVRALRNDAITEAYGQPFRTSDKRVSQHRRGLCGCPR